MLKPLMILLLMPLILLGVVPFSAAADHTKTLFYEADCDVDAVDNNREADFMVVYTPAHGDTTGTNAYGYEVAVSDGMVIAVGGNGRVIPKDGFVVSGHGTAKDWLRERVVVGMSVQFDKDNRSLHFVYSADSVKASVTTAMTDLQEAIDNARKNYVYTDVAAAEAVLAEANGRFEAIKAAFDADKDEQGLIDACGELAAELTAAQNALCESYPVQYRGVWIRPTQISAKKVEEYVTQLHLNGINTVSIEGFFDNSVIMEVPDGCLFEKNPKFKFDVLKAYVDACHKLGMECHLWMPIMCVGYAHEGGYERTVSAKKPEWLSLSNRGTPDNENGFMMIDPANKEARAYLVDFYKYIVTNYAIDCFELDYIRYYESTEELDFGYTEAAFAGFEEAYGRGVTPQNDRNADYWDDWCDYRRDCVTQMVKDVRVMMDEFAPNTLLAADVNPTRTSACNFYYQDYPSWMEDGLLDILHQMAYGDGFGDAIADAVVLGGNRTMVVTGLGVFMDTLGAAEMERQAREDNALGAYGDFYFEAQTYLRDKVYTTSQNSVYRREALAPFADPDKSVAACLDYMQGRIDDVLLPLDGVNEAEAEALKTALTNAKNTVKDGAIAKTELGDLRRAINALENARAQSVLKDDLRRATWISDVRHAADYHTPDAPADESDEAPAQTQEGMSVKKILLITLAVIAGIIGSAFGVTKLLGLKKKKA